MPPEDPAALDPLASAAVSALSASGLGVSAESIGLVRRWLASQDIAIGDGTPFGFEAATGSEAADRAAAETAISWEAVLALLDAYPSHDPDASLRQAGGRFASWLLVRHPVARAEDGPPPWQYVQELLVGISRTAWTGLALRMLCAENDRLDLHCACESGAGLERLDLSPLAEFASGALAVLADACGVPDCAVAGSAQPGALHLQLCRASAATLARSGPQPRDRWEALGRMASGVAHDFNNLLTVVLGCSEELLEDLSPDHPARDSAEQISEAAQRSAALTRQLLVFARRSARGAAPIELNAAIAKLERLLRRVLAEGHPLETSLADGLRPVHADSACVEQAIVHLVLNARDALPGGGRITLASSSVHVDHGAATAAGLAPGDYVRVEVEASPHPGTPVLRREALRGPGVELARHAARECGGAVEEAEGGLEAEGCARVSLVLPCAGTAAPGAAADPAPGADEAVLVLDASPPVGALLTRMLRQAGYRTSAASSHAEALASGAAPALVIADVALSDPDGVPAALALREHWPGLRILWMTGGEESALDRRGIVTAGPGAARLLGRPFSRTELLQAVRSALAAERESA